MVNCPICQMKDIIYIAFITFQCNHCKCIFDMFKGKYKIIDFKLKENIQFNVEEILISNKNQIWS